MASLPPIRRGTCHSIFVYDAAFSIDLDEAERRITSFKQRETIKHKRMAPRYFEYRPAPLRVTQETGVELVVYDFGAVSVLDQRLDEALGLAYEKLNRRSREWTPFPSDLADLREVSQWQVDSAILFEGVNNVLKLLGDQYLARLYRLIAERFHLTEWDASIFRKLKTLESIYEKISDQVAARRMEVLEWIIIALFVISIVLPFLTATQH